MVKRVALALLGCCLVSSCVVTGGGRCYRRRSRVCIGDALDVLVIVTLLSRCFCH